MSISTGIQQADWKAEKHAPQIEAPEEAEKDSDIVIRAAVGDAIPHPNTTEHFIAWIKIFFKPEGEKFMIQLADQQFSAHAESAAGANQGSALSEPETMVRVKLKKTGTIHALSYCNIHGLWESWKDISIK